MTGKHIRTVNIVQRLEKTFPICYQQLNQQGVAAVLVVEARIPTVVAIATKRTGKYIRIIWYSFSLNLNRKITG